MLTLVKPKLHPELNSGSVMGSKTKIKGTGIRVETSKR